MKKKQTNLKFNEMLCDAQTITSRQLKKIL